MSLTPLHYGITTRDAAMLIGEPESKVRTWKARGKLVLTPDGRICPINLIHWHEQTRDLQRARRNPIHQTRHNPYRHAS